jgi:cytosine/uracil/thiamine/allantoin permease
VPMFGTVAPFSWFIGAGLSGALYWATARREERAPDVVRGA